MKLFSAILFVIERSLRSTTSKRLKSIAKKIGLQGSLTIYVARHSYASGLKANGVATSAIKEAPSHKDAKTTEIYLKELGNNKILLFVKLRAVLVNKLVTGLYQSNR